MSQPELTLEARQDIWWSWQTRVTIDRLAVKHGTTKEEVRRIISLPRCP